MKIFITGATGVIGRRAIPLLFARRHQVTACVRSPQSAHEVLALGAPACAVSLFDRAGLMRAMAGHDVVVNLATHMPASTMRMFLPRGWRENDRIRRTGAANLVDAAIACGVQRFVQESFAPAYPDRGVDWIEEDTPLAPVRYNRSLLDAEQGAARFTAAGRAGIVLRFGAFYGADATQTLDLIRLVRRGWAPLPGPAGAYVSSVAHDDAACAVVAALDARAGIYNVVDDEPLTHRDYVDSLATALGVPLPQLPPQWSARLFGSLGELLSRSVRISNRKLRRETGWRPTLPSAREGWRTVAASVDGRVATAPSTKTRAQAQAETIEASHPGLTGWGGYVPKMGTAAQENEIRMAGKRAAGHTAASE